MRAALLLVLVVTLGCGQDRTTPQGSGASASAPPPQPQPQARVVSLSPSATEVVAALDATNLLVGVDDYSTYPPEVTQLPKIGSYLTPNLEAIVALRPTLVVVDDVHGQTARALGEAGVATVTCAIHSLGDVRDALHAVGAKLGRGPRADQAVAELDAAVASATARRPANGPRVLAIIDREPGGLGNLVAGGPGSWIDELLTVVGAHNVLAQGAVRYAKLSREEVLRARPEVILDLSFSARTEIAAWNELDVPAVKTGRVIALGEPYLSAPSPRVKQAIETLSRALGLSP